MTEIPDNVDLQWIGRHLVEFRQETRDALQSLRDDFGVMALMLLRIDRNIASLREETQRLWEAHGALRRRIETLEQK